jgi:hypothetical protein
VHPALAAWQTVEKAREDGRVVVGRCVCDQPLTADGASELPWFDWVLDTPDGPVTLTARGAVGSEGPIDGTAFQARMTKWFGWRFEFHPFLWMFQSTVMLSIVAPALLWLCALIAVIVFLSGIANPPEILNPGFRP